MPTLADDLKERLDAARARIAHAVIGPRVVESGTITDVGDGIATVAGLSGARLDELIVLPGDRRALAVSLEHDTIGCVLLDPDEGLAAGDKVFRTGDVARVPVGDALLGRIVDALGRPLDDGGLIEARERRPIERAAPGIVERELITQPLHTGITAIDALIPLGRGQRELIIGDRTTGKTAIAVDTILSQGASDVVCIYAAIGQKVSSVHRVIEAVRENGPFARTAFVVASADDPTGLQWIAPYAAMTMAEHVRDAGGHALLVIDDLTKHAAVHRQIALLLRYPPGREAYPGDIFYTHSRLLERSAKLSAARGSGSISTLAIAETQAGNISAYIPTNLISITDGQIYLEPKLFYEGQKPAINVGQSVSRVGGKTQAEALRTAVGSLKLDYAQFLELEIFTRFGQMVDKRTRAIIDRGERIRELLKQPQSQPLPLSAEVMLLTALGEGLFDAVAQKDIARAKQELTRELPSALPAVAAHLDQTGTLAAEDRAKLIQWMKEVVSEFAAPASSAQETV